MDIITPKKGVQIEFIKKIILHIYVLIVHLREYGGGSNPDPSFVL